MNQEQIGVQNDSQEKIINKEVDKEVVSNGVANEEEQKIREEEKAQRESQNNQKIEAVKEEISKQFGNPESKDEYPEGHILNSNMLDRIAKLEAIDRDTFEIVQSRYEKYIQDEKNGKHGENSVSGNQEKIKKLIEQGEDLNDTLWEAEIIYGEGGWNRYNIDSITGMVKLNSGVSATNTTGSKQYFEALRAKAKELGMDI